MLDKIKNSFNDFINFLSVYPGYAAFLFILGFTLGALHHYFGL